MTIDDLKFRTANDIDRGHLRIEALDTDDKLLFAAIAGVGGYGGRVSLTGYVLLDHRGRSPSYPAFTEVIVTRLLKSLALCAVILISASSFAAPTAGPEEGLGELTIDVDITRHRLKLTLREGDSFFFLISSGRPGQPTPSGEFTGPFLLTGPDDVPPLAIFYDRGLGIYGTRDLKDLGRSVTHGGIRLRMADAKLIQDEVRKQNDASVRIVVHE